MRPAFGSELAPVMVSSATQDGVFASWTAHPVEALALSPAAHALHYGSACFEGLKAHRGLDGVVRLFRPADHVERLRASASSLCLPVPDAELAGAMVRAAVEENLDDVPAHPGALYVRPTLLGVDPSIGAAATPSAEALLYVLASPVGEYFSGGRALTVCVETQVPRSTPQFGTVKCGANYAMALGVIQRARAEHGADQVLFAPGGDVQETGASNVVLLDDDRICTKALDGSFLHGITRDSLLRLAGELGYEVEERDIDVDELRAWAPRGEVALVGTAAVASAVGTLVVGGQRLTVGDGGTAPNTARLREALLALQRGEAPDPWDWTQQVGGGPAAAAAS